MTEAGPPQSLPQIGLVATDALRIMGLRTILGDGETCEIVPLWPPSAVTATALAVAIVDSSATGDVLEVLSAFRRLRPLLCVIVLGQETDPEHIERIIGAGAKGYLSHSANEAEVRMAISVVLDGSVWAPRKVLARLLGATRHETAAVLQFGGPSQIAAALGVDEGTVKAHMGRLMRKAGVDNRTALSMRAIERHWA